MERTLLFGEKGRIRGKGDWDAGFLRRVTALGEGRPDPALRPGGQGTAGEKQRAQNRHPFVSSLLTPISKRATFIKLSGRPGDRVACHEESPSITGQGAG